MKVTKLKNARLYFGNNIDYLQKIAKDSSVDLTVTSPPYDNLKNYKHTIDTWTFKDFKLVANELFRITREGGILVWVVCDATIDGSETGSSFRQALYFKKIGFNIHDTMIFAKQNFIPLYNPRQYSAFEYMFVFSKGKVNTFNPRLKKSLNVPSRSANYKNLHKPEDAVKQHIKYKSVKKYKTDSNIWSYKIFQTKKTIDHPATFPLELAMDHILTWSNEGNIVFDPFMGSGTTGRAAVLLDRKFIGVERVPEFYELSKNNIKSEINTPVLFRTLESELLKPKN